MGRKIDAEVLEESLIRAIESAKNWRDEWRPYDIEYIKANEAIMAFNECLLRVRDQEEI